MDLYGDIIQGIASFFEPVSSFPMSVPFILGISVGISLISLFLTKKFTDVEQLKTDMEEVKAWRDKFNEARKTNDPMLLQEVMDSQRRIMSIQSRMMTSRCKPMLLFYIPLLLIWAILGAIYGGAAVAILPFNVQDLLFFIDGWLGYNVPGAGFGLNLFSFYFLSSLGLGTLIRRASGLELM